MTTYYIPQKIVDWSRVGFGIDKPVVPINQKDERLGIGFMPVFTDFEAAQRFAQQPPPVPIDIRYDGVKK